MKKLLLIIILILFASCEKDDLVKDHYEQIMIIDEYTYSYSDSYNPERGWKDYFNGDYKYYFEGVKDVTVHPTQTIKTAVYLRSTMDKNPVTLPIINNSVHYENVTDTGVFRFTY